MLACFSASAPKGAPETWTSRQVSQWLKAEALQKKYQCLDKQKLDGKALLALDWNRVKQLLGEVPRDFVGSLNELRLSWNLAPVKEPAPEPEPVPEPPAAEEAAVSELVVEEPAEPAVLDEEVVMEEQAMEEAQPAEEVMTQLEITDRVTQESVVELKPVQSTFMHMQEVVTGVSDWAQVLHPFTEGMSMDQVVMYLESLGKAIGGGLAEAAAVQPAYGQVFGAAISLEATASRAGVARDNCCKAANLAADVLRILDAHWKKQHSVMSSQVGRMGSSMSDDVLGQMCSRFGVLEACVQPFTAPGWLLEICCNERMKERFDAAHNAVVDSLKRQGLDVLPGGKQLGRGDYRDLPRAVRRLVRQHGSGSTTSGLMHLKAAGVQSEGIKEMAGLLELGGQGEVVGPSLVMSELEALATESGLDVEVYYNSLVVGDNGGQSVGQVFDWYDKENTGYIDMPRFQCVLSDLGLLDGKTEAESYVLVHDAFKAAGARGDGVLHKDAFCAYYATLTTSRARQQLRTRMGLGVEEELRRVFVAFASFGSRVEVQDIDNARFYKLTKDCMLTGNNLTSTDVDLIFTKSKLKGARRINFEQFITALSMCAEKKAISLDDAVRKVLQTGGPVAHATKPDTVRLHDDKSTYTGVYAKGGPKAVDPPKNDLSAFLDRSEADVRGVKKNVPPPKAAPSMKTAAMSARKPPMSSPPPEWMRTSLGPGALAAAGMSGSPMMVSVSRRQSLGSSGGGAADLKEMFAAFALFGTPMGVGNAASPGFGSAGHARVEMDSARFQKLCRECRLFDTKGFNTSRADLIFTKVKQQAHNKIGYAEFERALRMIADAKNCSPQDVNAAICSSDGPLLTRMVQG